MTAKVLSLDEKYGIVFRVLQEIYENFSDAVTFEEFFKALTTRIVFIYFNLRETYFLRKENVLTSAFMIYKAEENSQLIN